MPLGSSDVEKPLMSVIDCAKKNPFSLGLSLELLSSSVQKFGLW